MKKLLLAALMGAVLIGCEEAQSEEPKEEVKQEAKKEDKPKEEKKEEKPKEEPKKEEPKQDQAELEQMALEIMKEEFEGNAEISFDESAKAFMVKPTGDAIIYELVEVMEGGSKENWNYMSDSMAQLSETHTDILGNGYSIMFVNPANPDNVLLIAAEGSILFDAFE